MLGKVQVPRTKQELIKSLTEAKIETFTVYEGSDLKRLPTKFDLAKPGFAVIVLKMT